MATVPVSAIGLIDHGSQAGAVRHAYRTKGDGGRLLCGRRLGAGTSRGNVWHDHGAANSSSELGSVSCPDCRRAIVRAGHALDDTIAPPT